jgi:outer membrane protein OmpA-like peptidoglycan-associated protein
VSESKKPPSAPPPDDYSKTTPNIDLPEEDVSADWDKTSYNVASDAPPDDWGKTVINYDSSSSRSDAPEDFDDTYRGGSSDRRSEEPDWGVTQANVNLGGAFEADETDFGGQETDTAATQHVIHIPELDRKKFQIPPTPTQRVEEERREKREQGGIPKWFWVTAGLMTMFFFSLIVILGVYFFLLSNRGYEVVVQGAPLGSSFHVDNGGSWGVPSVNNEHHLSGLEEGNRRIQIRMTGWKCAEINVVLQGGKNPAPIIANCTREDIASGNNNLSEKTCDETRVVEDRERCAEQILDTLGNPPDLDRLVKALNWLIINFESGKWDIPEPRKRILTKAASHMKNLPNSVAIEIGGHTDDRGTDAANQILSEKRANAVKDFLVNIASVRLSLLTTKGYGESKPKATNDTDQGRFDNRRIEYTVVKR